MYLNLLYGNLEYCTALSQINYKIRILKHFLGVLFLFTAEARENVLAAMKEIQNVSCVRFKDKEDGDKHWIKLVKKSG